MTHATQSPIHSDPRILGGAPVFVGTRVPVRALIDYLEGGDSLDQFLSDFPSVTREQAVAAVEEAAAAQRASARSRAQLVLKANRALAEEELEGVEAIREAFRLTD